MLPSFILALREGIEAVLIIGIVLGVLKKTHKQSLHKQVWIGTGIGVALSIFAALLLVRIGAAFEGRAEEIYEGIMMLLAAGILTWMIFWMRNRARNISQEIKAEVEIASQKREGRALFILALTAVLREGIELALFLTSVSFTTTGINVLIGAAAGIILAVLLAWLLNRSLIKLDLRKMFTVTSIILILFAAGLVAHGVHEFNEAGWIPSIIEHVWDMNHLIDEKSTFGLFLKALFGYNGNPSLTEVIAYVLYYLSIMTAFMVGKKMQNKARTAAVFQER